MKILKKFDSYIKENLEEEDIPEMSLDSKKIIDATEEDDSYIGTKMLNELADKLGVKVVDGAINYNGTKINFFSETEKFHIGKKKFATVDEVVNFLEKETPKVDNSEKEMDSKFMEDDQDFDDSDEFYKSDDIKESIITKRFKDFK